MSEITDIKHLKSLGPRIIVKVEPVEKFTPGGIELPAEVRRREQDTITEGTLIEIGDSAFKEMCSENAIPKIGDYVCFVKYCGTEIKIGNDFYRVMNDEDVFAYASGGLTDA